MLSLAVLVLRMLPLLHRQDLQIAFPNTLHKYHTHWHFMCTHSNSTLIKGTPMSFCSVFPLNGVALFLKVFAVSMSGLTDPNALQNTEIYLQGCWTRSHYV